MPPETGVDVSRKGDMRVLTVVIDLGIGGTQRVAQNVSIELRRRGVPVAVFAYGGGGPRAAPLIAAGVPVFVDTDESTGIDDALAWQPDVVHIHRSGYENQGETMLLRRFRDAGARIVETNVFARFDHSPGGRLIDAHCLVTEWCLFKWAAWGGRASKTRRAFVVPNAVDPDTFAMVTPTQREAIRADLGIPSERFLFGRVGQPISAKWSSVILDAFAEALAGGLDIGLLLVGAPDDILDAVKALPSSVQERIVLRAQTASDEELRSYYVAMDAMLHAAQIGETFGMVLCEAMMMGRPIVTLSTPFKDNGQLEVVGHEVAGLIALQPARLVDAIKSLVSDKKLYHRLSERARQWVLERYSVGVVVDTFSRIYAVVLDGADELPSQVRPTLSWAAELASHGIGRPMNGLERTALRVLHLPSVYRTYRLIRRLAGRA